MIFAIDHIVFAASAEQSEAMRKVLVDAGFSPELFLLEFPEIGARSESVSFAGGGFAEFVAAIDEALAPALWFEEIPRIIGLGFGSDDFDSDTAWKDETDAWVMNENHTLPDGSSLTIHAAGPHPHFSDFYVFVMDRPNGSLQFPERVRGPRLHRLSFAGEAAETWREQIAVWFGLAKDSASLRVGDVELTFGHRPQPGVRVTPVFEGAQRSARIRLHGSSIELIASSAPETGLGAEDQ